VLGLLLIASAAGSALFAAVAARFTSLVTVLLAAYVLWVANLTLVILVLSPFRAVTQTGLALAEALLLTASVTAWWLRGRPPLPTSAARAAAGALISEPATALFLVAVLGALAYELLLAGSPPNNMDSLTYHLAKAAAWTEHGGYYWIPNAPEVELNEYQPLAEQQDLFLFAATRSGGLYAAPQYLAQLAALLAAYGSARRLGFEVRAAAGGAFLLATFSIVALEAVTGQVDLVAAAFPAVAACLLLEDGRLQATLAGASIAFGLATKLTTALVLPVILLLALVRGRRVWMPALAGCLITFVTLGMWGYVLNAVHTGDPLGAGTGPVQFRGSPSYPGSVANAFYLTYGLMDLSVLSNHLIDSLAFVGVSVALVAGAWTFLRRNRFLPALRDAARVALPLVAPLLVVGGAALVAIVARLWGFPIRGPGGILGPLNDNLGRPYTRLANEDYSAYGPIGIVALAAASTVSAAAFVRHRADARHVVLASTLPLFLIGISLGSTWHVFLIRFFLLPAALAAPLLARLFHGRLTTAAYLVAATVTIALTLTHDEPKPLDNPNGYGAPWSLTQANALSTNSDGGWAVALTNYQAFVPPHACVGAILQTDEPSYLLFGAHFEHRVFYLATIPAMLEAERRGLSYVVFSAESPRWGSWDTTVFEANGWTVRPLNLAWSLATRPRPGRDGCSPASSQRPPALSAPTTELVRDGYPPVVGLPDQSLYLLQRRVYRHIPDPSTMTAHGITLNDVTWLPTLPLPLGRTLLPMSAPAAS